MEKQGRMRVRMLKKCGDVRGRDIEKQVIVRLVWSVSVSRYWMGRVKA